MYMCPSAMQVVPWAVKRPHSSQAGRDRTGLCSGFPGKPYRAVVFLGRSGWWLDFVILKVFPKLDDSMIILTAMGV